MMELTVKVGYGIRCTLRSGVYSVLHNAFVEFTVPSIYEFHGPAVG